MINICEKNKQTFICFFKWMIVNLILILLELKFCQPIYETNDDFGISLIAANGYGKYSQYLVFSNYVFGLFLKFLYWIIPKINWYIVLEYLFLAIAYSALETMVTKKVGKTIAIALGMGLWFLVIFNQIRFIQFTRTAYVISFVGGLLIIEAIKEKSKAVALLGSILSVVGYMYRTQCFWVSMVYILALIVGMCVEKQIDNKTFKKCILNVGIVVGVCVCLGQIDNCMYKIDDGWNEYRRYNSARAQLLDYEIPDYETNREFYESENITINDVTILSQWILNDTDFFTTEKLEKITTRCTNKTLSLEVIKNDFRSFCEGHKDSMWMWIFVILIIVVGLEKNGFIALEISGLTIVMFSYLFYMGRVLPRVEFGLWFAGIGVLLYVLLMNKKEKQMVTKDRKTSKLENCVAITAMSIVVVLNGFLMFGTDLRQNPTSSFMEYITKDDSNRYVLDVISFNGFCFNYKPYYTCGEEIYYNYVFSGGWESGSPLLKNVTETLGLNNPIKDLVDRDNVFYVSSRGVDCLYTYLREHYDENCEVKVIEERDGYVIYKFSK